jgi:hypothetical protein
MLRDQITKFLEAAVVFLMLTNALGIAAAAYALVLVQRASRAGSRPRPSPCSRLCRAGSARATPRDDGDWR